MKYKRKPTPKFEPEVGICYYALLDCMLKSGMRDAFWYTCIYLPCHLSPYMSETYAKLEKVRDQLQNRYGDAILKALEAFKSEVLHRSRYA